MDKIADFTNSKLFANSKYLLHCQRLFRSYDPKKFIGLECLFLQVCKGKILSNIKCSPVFFYYNSIRNIIFGKVSDNCAVIKFFEDSLFKPLCDHILSLFVMITFMPNFIPLIPQSFKCKFLTFVRIT